MKAVVAGRRVTKQAIEQIERTLRGREIGFREAHDTAAANEIVAALGAMVGDRDQAEAMKFIAERNGIKLTISTDPVMSRRHGRFLALATAIEQLLPLAMRSPTDEARAQRLKRAL